VIGVVHRPSQGAPKLIHGEFTQPVQVEPQIHGGTHTHQEAAMSDSKGQFRIELTPEQKAKIRNATGRDAEAVELSVQELEERIAPRKVIPGGGN
jgi:hypothetical protein